MRTISDRRTCVVAVLVTWTAMTSAFAGSPPAQLIRPFVRTNDAAVRRAEAVFAQSPSGGVAADAGCGLQTAAAYGQPIDQGTLDPLAFVSSASLAGVRIAFEGNIQGSARNQGVFRAENGVATPIAIGSGGGGGSGNPGNASGDPSPIGGKFSGFFGGTFFVPAINAAGDVLFLADVTGGSSPRGLFLAHNGGPIDSIAKVGGPAPGGGTFTQVGHGSMNDAATVVFVARASVDSGPAIFRWANGVLTKVARPGSPAPGGGTYTIIVGETLGFVDGTTIPVGPLPDINNSGVIAFRTLATGAVSRGIVLLDGAVASWAVTAGSTSPLGGTYLDMQAASLNDAGELAFFADINLGGGQFTSGWVAGPPSNLHKVIAFGDTFDGGIVQGLAFSRNPMQTIDAGGRAVVWCNVQLAGGLTRDRVAVVDAGGIVSTRAQQGDPASVGGVIGGMDAWPSVEAGVGATVSCGTPGAPGVVSAHQIATDCACVGDLSSDGEVDAEDLATLLGAWGTSGSSADLSGDGIVGGADVAILLGAWGTCPG